jgi:uroporphyrinogen decarboxylase
MNGRELLLAALRGQRGQRPPLWFMRQAGRYLPEYRALRQRHKMLDLMRTPELAAEVTLQPLKRFEFDAAIIFADILTPLIDMGVGLDFVEGVGPRLSSAADPVEMVAALRIPAPQEVAAYTIEALRLVRAELPQSKSLLGFAGAPWTLAAYLLEKSPSEDPTLERLKKFAREDPAGAYTSLCEKLCSMLVGYLSQQVRAGVDAVQLFDSWVGALSPAEFRELAAPWITRVIKDLRQQVRCPIIYFSTMSAGLLPELATLGADALSVDWRVSLGRLPHYGVNVAQGNLDPTLLYSDSARLSREVQRVLEEGRLLKGHIFNLGHGILPTTPIENVARVVEQVHAFCG